MRRGTCIKCGASTVRAAKNGIVTGEFNDTSLRPNVGPDFRGAVRRQSVDLWAFGCATCGYVELHLLDPAGLAYISEQWVEVPAAAPPASP